MLQEFFLVARGYQLRAKAKRSTKYSISVFFLTSCAPTLWHYRLPTPRYLTSQLSNFHYSHLPDFPSSGLPDSSQYYVVALYKCNGMLDGEGEEDFFISACGEYWLDYNPTSKTVTGLITTGNRKASTLKLAALEKLLKAN